MFNSFTVYCNSALRGKGKSRTEALILNSYLSMTWFAIKQSVYHYVIRKWFEWELKYLFPTWSSLSDEYGYDKNKIRTHTLGTTGKAVIAPFLINTKDLLPYAIEHFFFWNILGIISIPRSPYSNSSGVLNSRSLNRSLGIMWGSFVSILFRSILFEFTLESTKLRRKMISAFCWRHQ